MPDTPSQSALDQLDALLSAPRHPATSSLPPPPVLPPLPPAARASSGSRVLQVLAGLLAVAAVALAVLVMRPDPVAPLPLASEAVPVSMADACPAIAYSGIEWLVGPDWTVSHAEARAWAAGLTACGGGWRLPTEPELLALYQPSASAGTGHVERGRAWPAHIAPAFGAIGGGSWVWSAGAATAAGAPAVNLNQGLAVRLPTDGGGFSVRAFAVRSAR